MPYVEDTNIPMAIRGPGIQPRKSLTPSTHVDMAPTFLDMAGVPESQWPVFFDGRSLLPEWTGSSYSAANSSSAVSKEIINVEFWGSIDNSGSPDYGDRQDNNSYKSVRIVGEQSAWLFSRWCTSNETELYNTIVSLSVQSCGSLHQAVARLTMPCRTILTSLRTLLSIPMKTVSD